MSLLEFVTDEIVSFILSLQIDSFELLFDSLSFS